MRRKKKKLYIFDRTFTFSIPLIMKGDTKQQYKAPETTVLELDIEYAILGGSGNADPLFPEHI